MISFKYRGQATLYGTVCIIQNTMLPSMDFNVTQLTTVMSKALDRGPHAFVRALHTFWVFYKKLNYGESNCFPDDMNGLQPIGGGRGWC